MAGKLKGFYITANDQALIEKLKPAYRNVLNFTGSDESLAVHLNAPIGTAKSRRHRARTALQNLRDEMDADARNEEGAARHG